MTLPSIDDRLRPRIEHIPYPGILFTASASKSPRSADLRIDALFDCYTCYVKPYSNFWNDEIPIDTPFRFLVVAGPFERSHHKYSQAIAFRALKATEGNDPCMISGSEFNSLKDAARGKRKEPLYDHATIGEDLYHLRQLYLRGNLRK